MVQPLADSCLSLGETVDGRGCTMVQPYNLMANHL